MAITIMTHSRRYRRYRRQHIALLYEMEESKNQPVRGKKMEYNSTNWVRWDNLFEKNVRSIRFFILFFMALPATNITAMVSIQMEYEQ